MKISKIILYNEPSVLEIDIKKLKKFIENIFQIKIEIRNNIFENINKKTCKNIASSRIFNLKKTFQKHIPSIEEILIEFDNSHVDFTKIKKEEKQESDIEIQENKPKVKIDTGRKTKYNEDLVR